MRRLNGALEMMHDTPQDGSAATVPSYDARALVKDGSLAQIELDGQVYFLRITRLGKLILTK